MKYEILKMKIYMMYKELKFMKIKNDKIKYLMQIKNSTFNFSEDYNKNMKLQLYVVLKISCSDIVSYNYLSTLLCT